MLAFTFFIFYFRFISETVITYGKYLFISSEEEGAGFGSTG